MDSIGAYFVIRTKTEMRYPVIEIVNSLDDGILTDQLVILKGY